MIPKYDLDLWRREAYSRFTGARERQLSDRIIVLLDEVERLLECLGMDYVTGEVNDDLDS